jgi:hypothetical protein
VSGARGRRSRAGALAGLALCAAGCASDLASPFSAVVVAYDPASGTYRMAQDELTTLTSLRRLQGTSATVLAGGAVQTDQGAFLSVSASTAALRAQLFSSPASQVALSWNVIGGIVYPEDYVSLELLTAYRNLERVRQQLATWGLPTLAGQTTPVRLSVAPVYAHAAFSDPSGLYPLRESELYYPPLGAFFLPVPTVRSQLPLHFNLGAVAHGVALQLWQQVVWNQAPVDPEARLPVSDDDAVVGLHVGESISAGFGDFVGAAVTGDLNWLYHSLGQEATARSLDPQQGCDSPPCPRCSRGDMLQALDVPDTRQLYDPYPLGTVLAFCLAETAGRTSLGDVAAKALGALPAIAVAQLGNGGKLTLAAALDAFVAAVGTSLQPALCGSFHDRFKNLSIGATDLPTCVGVTDEAPAGPCL